MVTYLSDFYSVTVEHHAQAHIVMAIARMIYKAVIKINSEGRLKPGYQCQPS